MLSLLKNIQVEPLPVVHAAPERCLRRRLSTCDCRLCLDVCASGAISFDTRQLQLDPDTCTGCMACVAVCPNDALVGAYELEELLAKVREQAEKRLVISCIRQKRRFTEEFAVPCVGLFGEEALVALGRSGCRSIEFDLGGCPDCDNRQAAARFVSVLGRVSELAAQVMSTELAISDATLRETAEEEPDRRSFLADVRARLAAFSLVTPDLSGFRSSRRERSIGRRLPKRVKIIERVIADAGGESRQQLLALCTPRITTGPACNCCPLCTGICPTGALRVSGSGEEKRLSFDRTHCSGCGLCQSFCRKAAISLYLPPLRI